MMEADDNNIIVYTTLFGKGESDIALFKIIINDIAADCSSGKANAGPDKTICAGMGEIAIGNLAIPGSTYYWTSSDGNFVSQISQPRVSPSVSTKYVLSVKDPNNCLSRDTVQVLVNVDPNTIDLRANGSQVFCANQTVQLSASPGDAFVWMRDGMEISGVSSSVFSTSESGTYSVMRLGIDGCEAASSIILNATPVPAQPIITQTGTVLKSSALTGNQWYLDGMSIGSANNQLYAPLRPGNYTVSVSENGCESKMSAVYSLISTGVNDVELDKQFVLWPNPVKGKLRIFNTGTNGQFNYLLMNISGRQTLSSGKFGTSLEIDMARFNAGMYVLKILNTKNGNQIHKLIMKE